MDAATKLANEICLDTLVELSATTRPMFGGYTLYIDNRIVGVICDGHIFIKRSKYDSTIEPYAHLAAAYPGAKESWQLSPAELLQNPALYCEIIAKIVSALPERKPRSKK